MAIRGKWARGRCGCGKRRPPHGWIDEATVAGWSAPLGSSHAELAVPRSPPPRAAGAAKGTGSRWEIDEATVAGWSTHAGNWHVERALSRALPACASGAAELRAILDAAMLSGSHVAFCDASAAAVGASWSFGVFSPDGDLLLLGQGVFDRPMDSNGAESGAIEAAMKALAAMGAPRWLCLSDSKTSVQALGCGVDGVERRLAWAPRRFVRPANDRARQALGLGSGSCEPWEGWVGRMFEGEPGLADSAPLAISREGP